MTQSIGPPSLAQGTRIAVGFSTSISRFIPACGELSKPSWAIVQLDGSSPLARGTRMNVKKLLSTRRFIPAYAGNSILDIVYLPNHSVHPRLRGELFARKGDEIGYTGSSPLTRGTRAAHRIKNRFHRFIPAYAGNSAGKVLRRRSLTVHPRLRGELRGKKFKDDSIIGSSPLTRGTPEAVCCGFFC